MRLLLQFDLRGTQSIELCLSLSGDPAASPHSAFSRANLLFETLNLLLQVQHCVKLSPKLWCCH